MRKRSSPLDLNARGRKLDARGCKLVAGGCKLDARGCKLDVPGCKLDIFVSKPHASTRKLGKKLGISLSRSHNLPLNLEKSPVRKLIQALRH